MAGRVHHRLEDGLFPSLRERDGQSEDAALEEERRLAYVAITRARERLVLTPRADAAGVGRDPAAGAVAVPRRSAAGRASPSRRGPRRSRRAAPAIVDGDWARGRRRSPRASGRGGGDELRSARADDDEPVFRVDRAAPPFGAAADDDAPSRSAFRTGDQVSHPLHGVGRVIAITGERQGHQGDRRFSRRGSQDGDREVLDRFGRLAELARSSGRPISDAGSTRLRGHVPAKPEAVTRRQSPRCRRWRACVVRLEVGWALSSMRSFAQRSTETTMP